MWRIDLQQTVSGADPTYARRNVVLDKIYAALADTGRPVTTCDDVKKFNFPLLLLTGEKSPTKYELFYRVACPAPHVSRNEPMIGLITSGRVSGAM